MCTGKINCPGEKARIVKYSEAHSIRTIKLK